MLTGIFSDQWQRLVLLARVVCPNIKTKRDLARAVGAPENTVGGWKTASQLDMNTILKIKTGLGLSNEAVGYWLCGGQFPEKPKENIPARCAEDVVADLASLLLTFCTTSGILRAIS